MFYFSGRNLEVGKISSFKKTRKATGFKSLRLNRWNIIQVIWISKMPTSFSRLNILSYLAVFIKKINVLALLH